MRAARVRAGGRLAGGPSGVRGATRPPSASAPGAARRRRATRPMSDPATTAFNPRPPRPALAEFLAGCRHLRDGELLERLRADQSERWRAGVGVLAEEYLAACPE